MTTENKKISSLMKIHKISHYMDELTELLPIDNEIINKMESIYTHIAQLSLCITKYYDDIKSTANVPCLENTQQE